MARIIDVVSHPNVMEDELVWREPQQGNGDFRYGSQCIVQESQAAVFVRQGQALDVLGPGSHTLSTGNLPILSGLIGMVTSGNTPFTAEVYFVNLRDMPQVRWGTNPPVQMDTPGRGPGFLLLQSFGVVDISIAEPGRFLKQYGIGRAFLRLADIQDRIQTMLLSTLAKLLSKQNITGIQQANGMLGDLESGSLTLLNDDFAAIGMQIKAFRANPFQAKDLTPEDLVKYGGDVTTYERVKRLDVAEEAAKNPGGGAGNIVGAGIGFGIGQMIAGGMTAQPPQQPAQPAPAAPPAQPRTKEEVQAFLDQLDMKLANGEMSEDTYKKMYAKWEARLKELGG